MKPTMYFHALFLFLSVLFCAKNGYAGFAGDKLIQNYLKDLEANNYDKRTAPIGIDGPGSPVNVIVTTYILDINKMDDLNMDLNAQFYFRQSWNDSRLAHIQSNSIITLRDEDVIWTPDLFFIEEREGSIHQIIHPNKFIKIKPSGEVQYSVKLSVTFNCPMDLRNYPHDIQKCRLSTESYGFQRSQLNLEWKTGEKDFRPLSAAENIMMLDFDLIEVTPTSRNVSLFTGNYRCLQINLKFKRKFGFFATRLYVPYIILVLMSTLSLWIKAEERWIRLSLLLVILYLMVTISSEVNSITPPAPYTKAIDVWIGFCESLVFAAFLEFVVVALIAGRENDSCKSEGDIIPSLKAEAKGHNLSTDSLKSPLSKLICMFDARNGCKGKRNALSYRIDRICRVVFPLCFILFNIVYWSVYCSV